MNAVNSRAQESARPARESDGNNTAVNARVNTDAATVNIGPGPVNTATDPTCTPIPEGMAS